MELIFLLLCNPAVLLTFTPALCLLVGGLCVSILVSVLFWQALLWVSGTVQLHYFWQPHRAVPYDLPPAQLLNVMGESGVENLSLEKYWELLNKGNERTTDFCNLCFEDPKRRSIGLSQTCEATYSAR